MCGCLSSTERTFAKYFTPKLTVKLEGLYEDYLKLMLYAKEQNLFAERTERLEKAVAAYFLNLIEFDKENLDVCAVDAIHKLHPHDYASGKTTQ